MNIAPVLRYTVLGLSALVMIAGIMVIAGLLVPRNFPDQYRVVVGAVVFLYGAYRFAIMYYRGKRDDDEE